jgi:hypothetical protein
MRGDLYPPQIVYLPKNIPYNIGPDNQAYAHSNQRTELSFTGAFKIFQVTHNGDFRNPDGMQWSTTFDCTYLTGEELASAINQPETPFTPGPTTQPLVPPVLPGTPIPPGFGGLPVGRLMNRLVRRL